MPGPQAGDVLIRVQTNTTPTTYLILEAETHRHLDGPFPSMAEAAIAAAKHVGVMASVWQENLDQRGRPLGPPLRFPVTRT
jgi:hypothetical protein